MLVLDADGRTVFCNAQFRQVWAVPEDFDKADGTALLAHMNTQLTDTTEAALTETGFGPEPAAFQLTSGASLTGRFWTFRSDDGTTCRAWEFHGRTDHFQLTDARLRDYAELTSGYFWETDADGRFIYVSSQFSDVTGISRSQVMGKTRAEIWAENGRPNTDRNARYLAESHEHVTQFKAFSDIRVEWHRPDGRDLVLSVSGKPILDDAGDFHGYRGIGIDVTKTARTVEGLRDSEALMRDLLDGAPVGVSIVSQETSRRLYVNQAFVDIIGDGSADQLMGADAQVTWADMNDRDQVMTILSRGEDLRDFEHRRRRLDGTTVWTLMNSRAVEFAGVPAHIFWLVDITARRETERLVRESELRLRQILDQSPIAISINDVDDFRRQFVNPAFVEMIGADTVEAAVNVDIRETWADPAQFEEMRGIIAAGGDLDNFEGRRRRMDGTEFPCALTSRGIHFGGKSTRVFWSIDLTEQRRAEETIRQSEERLRLIIDSSPISFSVVSHIDGRRMFVNRRTLEMFGASDGDAFLAQKSIGSWADPNRFEAFRAALKGSEAVNFEAERVRADGSRFWALMNSRRIEFENERARAIWTTDISDRVASEASIRESEEQLREILETSPLGISVISRATRTRVFANNAMVRLFLAETRSAFTSAKTTDSWADADVHAEAIRRLESTSGLVNFEARRRRIDGSSFWCLHNSTEIVFEGEPAWVVWHNDISGIKAQQQAFIEAKEQADAANRAKSEFLSSMSHELRTPMNAILGFAQLLQLAPDAPLSASQSASVDQIMRGGQHLLALIDQILDLAKIEDGKVELDIAQVDVDATLAECRDLVQATADRQDVSLELDPSCTGPGLTVVADPTRLRQVMLNLLTNAIKYNRPGGAVRVSCAAERDGTLRIAVSDTGPGIPRDQWAGVFEPFSRLGAETTEIEGTGIGLTLARQLIEKMGGRIGFDSEVDVGSTFWINIPLAGPTSLDSPETGDSAGTPDLAAVREGVVLYVEDNPANLQLVALIFEHLDGLSLISAPTGEDGVEMAVREQPDAVLMDIHLPGIDGFEALGQLRANPSTAHIPVIALSADAMPENIARGRAAGFVDYLTKPLNVRELIAALNTALDAAAKGDHA